MVGEETRKKRRQSMLGDKNPNWKGGVGHDYAIRNFSADICEMCNSTENLLRHHIDGNEDNNVADNIRILCKKCHSIVHGITGGPMLKLRKGKEVPCDYCGKMVYRRLYYLKRNKHSFCNKKCKGSWESERGGIARAYRRDDT